MTPFPKAWSLSGTGYSPIFTDGRWKRQNRSGRWSLVGRRVDGLIVIGGTISSSQIAEMVNDLPVLLVARKYENGDLHSLAVDNERKGSATKHLIEQGHDRIAMIGGLADHEILRSVGYRNAMNEAGLKVDRELLVEGDFSAESGSGRLINFCKTRFISPLFS